MAKSFLKQYAGFIISGILILGLVAFYFYDSDFQKEVKEVWRVLMSDDREFIKEYMKRFGIWGPIALVIFIVLQMFLIIFPSWLPIIVGVLAYGFWMGVFLNLVGVGIASTIGYFIGGRLKSILFRKKKLKKMDFWISNYGFGTVILFRVSPFFSNDGISFLAGIFRMDFKKFMLATYCGMIPLSLAVGYFSKDLDRLENGLYWVGGVGAVLYAAYIYMDYKKRKKKN